MRDVLEEARDFWAGGAADAGIGLGLGAGFSERGEVFMVALRNIDDEHTIDKFLVPATSPPNGADFAFLELPALIKS